MALGLRLFRFIVTPVSSVRRTRTLVPPLLTVKLSLWIGQSILERHGQQEITIILGEATLLSYSWSHWSAYLC